MLKNILIVGAGGFTGAALRYIVYLTLAGLSSRHGMAYGTLAVNLTGSFLIGLLASGAQSKSYYLELFLIIGVLGGFTTFSSFSNDTMLMIHKGHIAMALGNVLLNIFLCLAGVFAGFELYKILAK
ncbi:CrcB protein [Parelusimicrobium proximum]|uniref:fluoride efflux transporter FluC n=1 Tax=Parelusimicrobium proximum TaxID=3228953 RepID=UPI003D165051